MKRKLYRTRKKLNLVFFIDNEKVVGGGNYAQFKFAEHLAKKGHKVVVFAGCKNKSLENLNKLPNFQLRFRRELPRIMKGVGKINALWNVIYSLIKVKPYLRKNRKNIDFLIGYLRKPAIKAVKLGKLYSIKTANFVFENPEWMERQLGKRYKREYHGKFKESWNKAKEAYLESNILFPNSKLTQKECSRWLKRKVANPIYPGTESVDADDQVAGEEKQIIYVGRLSEYKNVNILLQALNKLRNPPLLVLVGTGEKEKELRRLSKNLGINCIFRGSLTDEEKQREIKKSLFMVFPSSFEGFGMPPMEALACGIPCICTDIPIFREIYQKKVEYFPENNTQALAKKIDYLLKNPKISKMKGRGGRRFVTSKYRWEKSAHQLEMALVKEIKRRGRT